MRILEYCCEEGREKESVRSFLKRQGYPNSVLSRLRGEESSLSVRKADGEWERIHLNERISPGETLRVCLPEREPSKAVVPVEAPFGILYEDEDILVVNKPAGLPMHSSQNHHERTLANAVAFHWEAQGEKHVFHCANRLDKNTSGVTIIAKNELAAALISEAVKRRQIRREYLAVVTGVTEERGRVEVPIGRVPGSVILRQPAPETGEEAVTEYERLAVFQAPSPSEKTGEEASYSLLRLRLKTGRTHQIRVHMKYIGHPLPGDFLYDPDYTLFARQPLHSFRMRFRHPVTGEEMCFTAPLPEDMARVLKEHGVSWEETA